MEEPDALSAPLTMPPTQPYPQTPGAKLWAACREGDLRVVRALIADRADPNAHASASTGSTALHEAMLAGHREVVQALLAAGALVSTRDSHGNTPLHACAASSTGDDPEQCAQLLALPHCDAREVNSDGATALHLAALRGKPAMAKLLVEHGAPLHGLDRHGRDALTFAADVATERMLLELLGTEVLRAEKAPKETRWPSATPWHLSQVPATTEPRRAAPDRLRPPPRNVEPPKPPPPPPPPPPPRSGKPGPPGPKRYGANGQELPEAGAPAAKGDGARSEHERLVRAFLAADADGSGAVSKRELQRILVAVGVRAEATRLFRDADVNRDGEQQSTSQHALRTPLHPATPRTIPYARVSPIHYIAYPPSARVSSARRVQLRPTLGLQPSPRTPHPYTPQTLPYTTTLH